VTPNGLQSSPQGRTPVHGLRPVPDPEVLFSWAFRHRSGDRL